MIILHGQFIPINISSGISVTEYIGLLSYTCNEVLCIPRQELKDIVDISLSPGSKQRGMNK